MFKIYLVMLLIFTSYSVFSENSSRKPSKKVKNKKLVVLNSNVKEGEQTKEVVAKPIPYDGDPLAPLKIHKDKMKEQQKKQKK